MDKDGSGDVGARKTVEYWRMERLDLLIAVLAEDGYKAFVVFFLQCGMDFVMDRGVDGL